MTRKHPVFVLLLLFLALCIFSTGIERVQRASSAVPACEVGLEDAEVGAEELLEEDLETDHDLFALELMAPAFGDLAKRSPLRAGISTFSPSYCSFGWVLPLRI